MIILVWLSFGDAFFVFFVLKPTDFLLDTWGGGSLVPGIVPFSRSLPQGGIERTEQSQETVGLSSSRVAVVSARAYLATRGQQVRARGCGLDGT